MTFEDAQGLSSLINSKACRFVATPYDVDKFSLVFLYDRYAHNTASPCPITQVNQYLVLMKQGSDAVEADPDLLAILDQWQAQHGNRTDEKG